AAVGDILAERYNAKIVIIGGPGEKEIGHDIERVMKSRPRNLVGTTSVREMMAVINACRLIVTNDSGPMHVAAALNVPVVAIFGPTDHTTTYPWCEHYKIVRSNVDCAPCLKRKCPTDHCCMLNVTVDDVVNSAADLYRESYPDCQICGSF
ncbi:MAG: lipopolysaccharide heptosyltransferase II, partial [Desulfuromonas sp.]